MLNKARLLARSLYLKRLVKNGLKVGFDFQMEKGCNIDANFPWLIEIGNNVTFASKVCLLAHDASTKKLVGYTRIGRVSIGNNVFIGYGAIVLPGVSVGDDAVVGAGALVTKDVPAGKVVAGVPARVLGDVAQHKSKAQAQIAERPAYGAEYLCGAINDERVERMRSELADNDGFIL